MNLTVVKSCEESSVRFDSVLLPRVVYGPFKWFELSEVSLCFHAVLCAYMYMYLIFLACIA